MHASTLTPPPHHHRRRRRRRHHQVTLHVEREVAAYKRTLAAAEAEVRRTMTGGALAQADGALGAGGASATAGRSSATSTAAAGPGFSYETDLAAPGLSPWEVRVCMRARCARGVCLRRRSWKCTGINR